MYTKEQILNLIDSNDLAVERGVLAIFNRQTYDEQKTENTSHFNHIGFSSADAKRLSYYAKWILSGKHLSGHHLEIARKRIKKYIKQLLEISNSKVLKAS